MKKLMSLLVASFLILGLAASTASADATKGQKLYLKFLKGKLGMNGVKFCSKYSQDEWEELFEDDASAFIKEFSSKYPDAKNFLEGAKFQKIKGHIKDFAIEYANDSGNVPSC
jgi:hypothetical protein